jgi:transcriptional regulator with XRE-family HTH domain
MSDMTVKISSPRAKRALQEFGANLRTARLKRRISIKGFAERAGVSTSTIIRLEKGDGGVSIGTLAMACLVLGEIDRIAGFLDPGTDDTGLLLDKQALPKRIDSKRGPKSGSLPKSEQQTPDDDDVEGVGF